jgi:hypothetical protein
MDGQKNQKSMEENQGCSKPLAGVLKIVAISVTQQSQITL